MRPSPPRRKARSVLQGLQQALRLPFAAAFFCLIASAATADTRSEGAALVSAVVRLTAEVPPDARTAAGLGTQRDGNGVVIDDSGLILTIGYLILEAMTVTAYTADGKPVPADILAYDYDTGFGLVRALGPLAASPVRLGDSTALEEGEPVLVVASGGRSQTLGAFVVDLREFAGYWEYLLERAVFTSPPHPNWGGAALLNRQGRLVGIGSLLVQDAMRGAQTLPGNMFVPVEILRPILADLLGGTEAGPRRPWLGIIGSEGRDGVVVVRVAPDGPAARAGIRRGDVIRAVSGTRTRTMAEMYRKLWALGDAGIEVPLSVHRGESRREITVRSGDRYRYLKLDRAY